MVARSYLDALTSGMLAKLDPLSRIARAGRMARRTSVAKNESAAAPLKHALWPGDRYKRRAELRTRVAGR